ncbi:hypothetical protein [Lysinibacillus sphaericus]|uniref:hypothetical protein n=1 Tax=Lysinibacillus sphaericus TaxID=1421 RepID=UPI003F79C6BF
MFFYKDFEVISFFSPAPYPRELAFLRELAPSILEAIYTRTKAVIHLLTNRKY